jgi:hypothetical protein
MIKGTSASNIQCWGYSLIGRWPINTAIKQNMANILIVIDCLLTSNISCGRINTAAVYKKSKIKAKVELLLSFLGNWRTIYS